MDRIAKLAFKARMRKKTTDELKVELKSATPERKEIIEEVLKGRGENDPDREQIRAKKTESSNPVPPKVTKTQQKEELNPTLIGQWIKFKPSKNTQAYKGSRYVVGRVVSYAKYVGTVLRKADFGDKGAVFVKIRTKKNRVMFTRIDKITKTLK